MPTINGYRITARLRILIAVVAGPPPEPGKAAAIYLERIFAIWQRSACARALTETDLRALDLLLLVCWTEVLLDAPLGAYLEQSDLLEARLAVDVSAPWTVPSAPGLRPNAEATLQRLVNDAPALYVAFALAQAAAQIAAAPETSLVHDHGALGPLGPLVEQLAWIIGLRIRTADEFADEYRPVISALLASAESV